MLMVEYEYDWRFISSDARRRILRTYLECHDEPKESLLDFQVDIGIVLIPENILHRFAQPADEGIPEVLDFPLRTEAACGVEYVGLDDEVADNFLSDGGQGG